MYGRGSRMAASVKLQKFFVKKHKVKIVLKDLLYAIL